MYDCGAVGSIYSCCRCRRSLIVDAETAWNTFKFLLVWYLNTALAQEPQAVTQTTLFFLSITFMVMHDGPLARAVHKLESYQHDRAIIQSA